MSMIEDIRKRLKFDKDEGHGFTDYIQGGQVEALLAYYDAAELLIIDGVQILYPDGLRIKNYKAARRKLED